MSIQKPVIIFGTGRSGTTVVHRMLSTHESVSWLSTLCDIFPQRPELNQLLMFGLQIPMLGGILERRLRPSESYQFWERYCKGFSVPCRDLRSNDLSTQSKQSINAALQKCIAANRPRLLLKVTGWPRLGFLESAFNDAKFIHVIRDGRAVANSLIEQAWWWGWRGPENWRWGPLPESSQEEWEASGKSFIVLAAIQWKMHMAAAESTQEFIHQDRILNVRYEALCQDPGAVMRDVARFSELEWSAKFERRVDQFRLHSANDKWRSSLNMAQQRDLQRSLDEFLARYGYS